MLGEVVSVEIELDGVKYDGGIEGVGKRSR